MTFRKLIKSVLLVLLTFPCFQVCAQEAKEPPVTLTKAETTGFTFEKIVDLPSISKEQAYDRIKQWVLSNLKTVDNNISFDDAGKNNINTATALIIEKRKWMVSSPVVQFKISFSFKENKMKVNASQFILTDAYGVSPFEKIQIYNKKDKEFTYQDFDAKFNALINAAEAAASKKDDKW